VLSKKKSQPIKGETTKMGKKNIKPQQQQPIIRNTTAKAIAGLTEENLTEVSQPINGAIPSSNAFEMLLRGGYSSCSFDGDDAE
jgi:bacteriocin leader peptide (microcyclamide/patellamide family)